MPRSDFYPDSVSYVYCLFYDHLYVEYKFRSNTADKSTKYWESPNTIVDSPLEKSMTANEGLL